MDTPRQVSRELKTAIFTDLVLSFHYTVLYLLSTIVGTPTIHELGRELHIEFCKLWTGNVDRQFVECGPF